MGCYSLTLPLSEDLHVAKFLQDIGLSEKYGLQNSPLGGGKPYPASGLLSAMAHHLRKTNIEDPQGGPRYCVNSGKPYSKRCRYFRYQIFRRVTYVMGCYSLTLPLSEDLHVAKSLQDIGLSEKYGLQNSPLGGGKPYPASGLLSAMAHHLRKTNIEDPQGGPRYYVNSGKPYSKRCR